VAEIGNVVAGTTISTTWGNQIRDRTVQRYASSAARASGHPTPTAGDLSYLADTGDIAVYHAGIWKAFLPTGAVLPFASGTTPAGFLLCNGAAVSRTTYASLFAVIGTAYGVGDGSTTFNVPDLRGRFPLGKAAAGTGSSLGDSGGALGHTHAGPSHTHAGPSHTHTILSADAHTSTEGAHTHAGASHSHSFSDTSSGPSGTGIYVSGTVQQASTQSHTHSVSGTTGSAAGTTGSGGGHAHDVAGVTAAQGTGSTGAGGTGASGASDPPYLALNFIIKA
jgi:microcystin-dependent protein